MPEQEVTCPSGLAGVVRGLKTREANMLANRRLVQAGTSFDKVLAACWQSTADAGPYGDGPIDWGKALVCDRFWALLRIRAATFGDSYEFDVPCQDRQLCGKKISWECDLSELDCRPLPEASRAKIQAGENVFEHELQWGAAAGKTLTFRLLTGEGERAGAKLVEGQDTRVVVAALATRLIAIEGVEKGKLIPFLDDLEMADLMGVIDALDAVDGGVDTTIEIECNHCGLSQDVELPLGRAFFMPRSRKRKSSPLDRL